MKKFKQIDLFTSLALIIGFTIVSLIKQDLTFIYGYFITGGWQLISMIVHTVNRWFMKKDSSRYMYEMIVAVIITIALLGLVIHPLLLIFYFLLFAAPVMAIIYTIICYEELKEMIKRPLSVLK